MSESTHGVDAVPVIRRLTIENFRGLNTFEWHPAEGLNFILGGGDVGKTTILEAIALLLSPTNSTVLTDADYWARNPEAGFRIEAVMSLSAATGIHDQSKAAWPWVWDGRAPTLPSPEGEGQGQQTPVYRLQVRGTPDMDLAYEIIQPDGATEHLSVSLRRRIGLVRLSGDDRNDRDLRLLQGSALDRLLADRTLRGKLARKLSEEDVEKELTDPAKAKLEKLDAEFSAQALPSGLGLGLVGGQGASLNALLGLVATKMDVRLPLASWGSGTRRLAALEIAEAREDSHPITVVDEIERGLEPYRQRLLVASLKANTSQTFATTHSPIALSAAQDAALWYMDASNKIGRLPTAVEGQHSRDPEAFLSRLTIVAEGATEVGFLRKLLPLVLKGDPLEHGVWVTDACGNDHALKLLEGLAPTGLVFAGFADDEGRDQQKWQKVKDQLGDLLFRWPSGCLEENVIRLVPDEKLHLLAVDRDGETGDRCRTLADRLGIQDKSFDALRGETDDLRELICQAATAAPPQTEQPEEIVKAWKKHGKKWFKSVEGGEELADKAFTLGIWPGLEPQLLPFFNAVRRAIGLAECASVV